MYANGLMDFLPPGLSLSTTGLLAGTPTSTGSYPLCCRRRTPPGNDFTRWHTISIANSFGLMVREEMIPFRRRWQSRR